MFKAPRVGLNGSGFEGSQSEAAGLGFSPNVCDGGEGPVKIQVVRYPHSSLQKIGGAKLCLTKI